MDNVMIAFSMTLLAGLSTGIGSLIAFLGKTTNKKFLSVALGFSGGVMIYVSMIEIFAKARDSFIEDMGERSGNWMTVIAFFSGMFIIAIIDKMVPSYENPHEIRSTEGNDTINNKSNKLFRVGILVAMAIAIHNFPEGLATFMVALHDPKLALPIVFAIALHNIPEGISVSIPVYYATGSRKKAFLYSFFSGLAEPLGALIGYIIIRPFMNNVVFGFLFAAVAGVMVFISLDELLPAAREYGEHHLSIYGLVIGMVVMALSLLLFI